MAEPISTFYGIEIPAGKSVLVTPRVDEEMTGYEIINLTQVALGAKPAKGAHTLFIQSIGNTDDSDSEAEAEAEEDVDVEGPKIAIATLDAVHHPHVSVDFSVSLAPILVSHTGASSLFLSGYAHRQEFPADEDDFEQSDSDEEGAPNGVPLGSSDEDDEAYDSDESMDEDEEDEDEEEEPEPSPEPVKAPAPKRKGAAEPTPAKKAKAEPAPAPAAKKPEPAAKKAAPAAKKAEASGDDAAKEYVEALKSAVKAKGTVRLAELGSAVKRPAAAPKLKTAIEKNKAIFTYDEKTGSVSLA